MLSLAADNVKTKNSKYITTKKERSDPHLTKEKKYQEAQIEVILIESNDVISTSAIGGGDFGKDDWA